MYGIRLKELRKENGLSQVELARKLQTTQRNISKYELETLDLSTEFIIKICTFFGVSADYLLGLEDETGAKTYSAQNAYYNNGTHNGNVNF